MSSEQSSGESSDGSSPVETPSEEARRRTDGDRWQASLDSWSTSSDAATPQRPDSGTQEIRLDQPVGTPAGGGTPPWSAGATSWEGTAQQPSTTDDRSWEQQSRDQIAAWQQPPSWQQDADAQRSEDAPAPSGRPADQPVGQPAPWDAAPDPARSTPATPSTWDQQAQQAWPQAEPQRAWEPPPGARPWEQQSEPGRHGHPGAEQGGPSAPQQSTPPQSAPQQSAPEAPGQQWGQSPSGGWGSQGSSSWTPGPQHASQQPTHQQPTAQQPPPSLTSQSLLRQTAEAPTRGWRRFLHKASGGTVNPGLSQAELEHRALVQRVTTPVRGSNRIAVVSLKGGIGKTTTTCCLGLTLAHHRGDRVVAVDANPDAGTLAERLTNVTDVTVRDLLAAKDRVRSFTDVSAFTSLAGRLQVLASDQDPALSEAFSEEEYTTVADILARYFNLILTDSGTGLLHSAMSGTLAIADSLVVVGAPSVDGASRASKTLDWLIAHGHEELVARSVAVISSVRPNTGDVDMGMVRDHFAARCRAVVEIPYDAHLVTGGLIDLDRVGAPARKAYLELAAHVADGFALPPLQRASAQA
ncbi:AAA family ATPase [Klenkia sp. LSe6-5]|uniref:AAA family ATPase n=1 Tax=Klenkia sesuvii TaxID=3103137 RepID=A0ABU8DXY2_9ACTN